MSVTLPPPVPTSTPLAEEQSQSGVSLPWLRWFQQMQARIVNIVPGPYADDPTAAKAGVNVGQPYYLPTGAVVVRLT